MSTGFLACLGCIITRSHYNIGTRQATLDVRVTIVTNEVWKRDKGTYWSGIVLFSSEICFITIYNLSRSSLNNFWLQGGRALTFYLKISIGTINAYLIWGVWPIERLSTHRYDACVCPCTCIYLTCVCTIKVMV